jgi:hypothetical protein
VASIVDFLYIWFQSLAMTAVGKRAIKVGALLAGFIQSASKTDLIQSG